MQLASEEEMMVEDDMFLINAYAAVLVFGNKDALSKGAGITADGEGTVRYTCTLADVTATTYMYIKAAIIVIVH